MEGRRKKKKEDVLLYQHNKAWEKKGGLTSKGIDGRKMIRRRKGKGGVGKITRTATGHGEALWELSPGCGMREKPCNYVILLRGSKAVT